jgi:two-component system, NtrC family, nitrogen regulation sensor histidine kinase NtrY
MFLTRRASKSSKSRLRVPFGDRLLFSICAAGFPAVVLCLILLWSHQYSLDHKLEGTAFVLISWLGLSFSAHETFIYSIGVLANVVTSLREENFSFRADQTFKGDALGDLALEINSLADALENERLGAMEATSLLRKVMAEAGAVILAFSSDGKVRLLNRQAAALLGAGEERILHRSASELGIQDLLDGPASEIITRSFASMERRWLVRRTWFRQHGIRHRLVVLSEASEALRAEERIAWQRLIRVLSHEINNSLAAIKSIARTLRRTSDNVNLPADAHENLKHGLEVIGTRAESLNRFLQNFAQLAKLPAPTKHAFDLKSVMLHVISVETRLPVLLQDGPAVFVFMDSDQLQNALINLIKNAAEAVLEVQERFPQDAIVVSWKARNSDLEIIVQDRGIGLSQTDNLFVPLYTTKQTGAGIGLILSRQIVENHSGQLTIRNRKDTHGCEVIIRIPECIIVEGQQRSAQG